jgi:chromosome partitioning protein
MVIVFANTKGGVGKSTLAVHLAIWLFDHGHSVALLDADRQRSSSVWLNEAERKITTRTAWAPEDCVTAVRQLQQDHAFVIGDGQASLDDLGRTLLLMADLAVLPVTPSILDVRSVQQATGVLRYAQELNRGGPEGWLLLNRMRRRDVISREVTAAMPAMELHLCAAQIRDLQAFRDAAQQGTVVTRMGRRGENAAADVRQAFGELLGNLKESTLNWQQRRKQA